MNRPVRIAVVGDIHHAYEWSDNAYFDRSEYDLLLFVGDLSDFVNPKKTFSIARKLARLTKPAILIPGNHDVHNAIQFIAELFNISWMASLSSYYHYEYHQRLAEELNPVALGGYSIHPYQGDQTQVDIIVARPYAMGESKISFMPIIRRLYGVKKLDQSIDLLRRLVDLSEAENILFLAHNGPSGLGSNTTDIWGCDFDPEKGDFGDSDLAEAVQYAQSLGKRVLAVVAGHMHLQTYLGPKPFWKRRGIPGPERPFCVEKNGVCYVNAARVPRIINAGVKKVHHHIGLEIEGDRVMAKEIFIEMKRDA